MWGRWAGFGWQVLGAAPLSKVTIGYRVDSPSDSSVSWSTSPVPGRVLSTPEPLMFLLGLARALQPSQPLSARLGLLGLKGKEKVGLLWCGRWWEKRDGGLGGPGFEPGFIHFAAL